MHSRSKVVSEAVMAQAGRLFSINSKPKYRFEGSLLTENVIHIYCHLRYPTQQGSACRAGRPYRLWSAVDKVRGLLETLVTVKDVTDFIQRR